MKVYQVRFDTCLVTLLVNDEKDILNILKAEDENFFEINNKIYYDFDGFEYECDIDDVSDKIGIIQFESH